jgi:phosphoglycolate phosphatase-like HAD superfamily hydrolase
MTRYFVFFDVDETLVYQKGSVRAAMALALHQVYGETGPIDDFVMDGKTDWQIFGELLALAGLPQDLINGKLEQVFDAYCRIYPQIAQGYSIEACPGAAQLLDMLAKEVQEGKMTLGLLTGNLERIAYAKLHAVGIDTGVFELGAFGSDGRDRITLAQVARGRASRVLGSEIQGEDIVIIGDTPHDIRCAQAIGARVIVTSTGRYSLRELQTYQPTFGFPDLTPVEAIVRAIKG